MNEKYIVIAILICVVLIISHLIAYLIGEKYGIKSMVEFYKCAYPKKYFTNLKRLEYKGYNATYSYDERDNIFYGTLYGIKDKVCFQCYKEDEIEKEFHKSVDDYLNFCKEIGKKPDIPTKE